jgi:hypothetical protein
MQRALSDAVEKFQIIYRRDGTARLRIVKRPAFSADAETCLRDYLGRNLPDMAVQFEYVARIDADPSGKYRIVINE